jgi:hypothetical protein
MSLSTSRVLDSAAASCAQALAESNAAPRRSDFAVLIGFHLHHTAGCRRFTAEPLFTPLIPLAAKPRRTVNFINFAARHSVNRVKFAPPPQGLGGGALVSLKRI